MSSKSLPRNPLALFVLVLFMNPACSRARRPLRTVFSLTPPVSIPSDSAEAYKIAYTQGTKDQLSIDQEQQAAQQKLDDDARREATQQQQGEDSGDSGFLGTLGSVAGVVGSLFGL